MSSNKSFVLFSINAILTIELDSNLKIGNLFCVCQSRREDKKNFWIPFLSSLLKTAKTSKSLNIHEKLLLAQIMKLVIALVFLKQNKVVEVARMVREAQF
jgi:hypothetical protein